MNLFISADIEGASGVAVSGHGNRTDPLYEHARKWMVHDVNAVCEGAFSAGASRVLVKDAHGPGTNLLAHKIDERAELFTGWGPLGSMVEGLDSTFDGLMLVGYHSRAGTERGVLSHTFMGQIESLRIGGIEVGETGIAAAWAGHRGVPVILVAGDEAVTVEAEELLPGVTVCAVKRGLNRESAITLSRKERKRLLAGKAREAVENRDRVKPLVLEPKLEIKWRREVVAEQTSFIPGVERKGPRTVAFSASDMPELFRVFRVARHIAARYPT